MERKLPFEVEEIAAQFGTPLYLYDGQQLEKNIRRFYNEIQHRPLKIHASLMAQDTSQLLTACQRHGLGAFVNSSRHLAVALHQVGWSPDQIIFASSNVSESFIRRLAELGVIFHANSLRELEIYARLTSRRTVALRLAWPTPGRGQVGRLGLRQDELATAQQIAARYRIKITGFHLYLGTNLDEASYYLRQIAKLLPLIESFPHLSYLDLSGGFSTHFNYQQLSAGLSELLSGKYRNLTLVLEPGRSLFADAGYYITRVVEIKQDPNQLWVGVDGSVTHLPLALTYPEMDYHSVALIPDSPSESSQSVTICGASTFSRDYLARDVSLPTLEPGDLLCFDNAGAYTYASLTNYLGLARPPQIFVKDKRIILLTPREVVIL